MIPIIEPRILPGWTWAVVTVGLMAGAGMAGYRYADARGDAALARCRAASADFQRRASEEAAARLAAADAAARAAQAELSRREAAYRARLKETRDEIYRLSTGRECLSGPLRLRINSAIGADPVPARAGEPDRAAAQPAADPILHPPSGRESGGEGHPPSPSGRGAGGEGATDVDLAGWILDAAALYGQCRARIDAIRQWDEVTHGR
ncbi:MAG: hypothetical protein Fur0039_15360 [Rhodocyclaceae bacterium]